MGDFRYVRYQAAEPNARGTFPGVFGLFNGLARSGRLTAEQESFRRVNNAWYNAAYTDPSTVEPTVYDRTLNPGATAWFKAEATHLVERIDGYLAILDAHGVAWQRLESDDPGRVIYEDADQVVVVPHSGPRYVRYQAVEPNSRGIHPGVFMLVNVMGKSGRLTEEQESFRRTNNDWYDVAYPDPMTVDSTVYDLAINPGAAAWFKTGATHLVDRVPGYLAILDAHGVAWQRLESDDPGRVIYEDEFQVVVVPHDQSIKLD